MEDGLREIRPHPGGTIETMETPKSETRSTESDAQLAEYERPAIIHSERVEARALVCAKVPSQCNPGPAHS